MSCYIDTPPTEVRRSLPAKGLVGGLVVAPKIEVERPTGARHRLEGHSDGGRGYPMRSVTPARGEDAAEQLRQQHERREDP
jgi:hypothetical protein